MFHQRASIFTKMILTWKSLHSLLFLPLCIQFIAVRSAPHPKSGPGHNMKSPNEQDIIRKDDNIQKMKNSEHTMKSFSNVLHRQLKENDVLIRLFSKPVDRDIVAKIASAIANSLVIEAGIVDSHSATKLIMEALLYVNPTKGHEAYCEALINVIEEILLTKEILDSDNYFALANIVSEIILNSTSDVLNSKKNSWLEDEIEAELKAKINTDTSAGLDIASRTGRGINTAAAIKDNSYPYTTPGTGLRTDVGSNVLDPGLNTPNLGFRADTGLGATTNLDVNVGANSLLGKDTNLDFLLGTNLNSVADIKGNIDLRVSEEAILQFKSELTNKLLRDSTFRYVFRDNVPPNALRQIIAAICHYISKAFAISRSFLLPLENSIGNLSLDSTLCPELYSNIITEKLTNLFSSMNLITNDAVSLQATIAANAIISGIANFVRVSTITNIGFNINENSFNTYFSALNGLEKLPYVGVEAISPKLSPALKLTYSSRYASQFAKTLFYNLISSSKFLEVFSRGVPAFANETTMKFLGKFVAEAFGSSNPKLFYDIYCKSLLKSIQLNSLNYAKTLSSATARALLLNGYFLSGNINIQAAVAKNAIIRALTTQRKPVTDQVTLFPNVLRLPWITQLNGVLPSQMLLKYGIDAGLNAGKGAGVGLKLDESIDTRMNSALEAGVRANAGLGQAIDTNTGGIKGNFAAGQGIKTALETGQGIDAGSGVDLGLNTGGGRQHASARQVVNAGLGADLGLNTNLGGIGNTNAGLRTGQVVNAGLGTDLGLNAGLAAGLGLNAGLGGRQGMNAGLGGRQSMNAGLKAGQVMNAGFGTDLGLNAGLGAGLGLNTGSAGRQSVNADLGGRRNAKTGFKAGQVVNAGLGGGLGMDLNPDLEAKIGAGLKAGLINAGQGTYAGSDLGVYTGLGGIGSNAAFETEQIRNSDLRTGLGMNTALGVGIDSNRFGLGAGIGVNSGLGARLGTNVGSGRKLGDDLGASLESNSDLELNTGILANLDANNSLGNLQLQGLNIRSSQVTIKDDSKVERISRKKRSTGNLPFHSFDWDPNFDLDSKNLPDTDSDLGFLTKSKTVKSNNAKQQQKSMFRKNGINTAAKTGTWPETDLNVRTEEGLKRGDFGGLDIGIGADLNTGIDERLGAETRVGLRTGSYTYVGEQSATALGGATDAVLGSTSLGVSTYLGAEFGFNDGVNLGTVKGDSSNTQLSIINVLPLILANKLYGSTALYTSISMVGAHKIINLISQAMACEFGFPIATLFLRSYEQHIVTTADDSFEIIMVGLAKATTEALAAIGFLNSRFSVSTANQLADAIVIKFSSLIATSLEAKEYAASPQWTYLLGQDLIQPPLIPGYNTYK